LKDYAEIDRYCRERKILWFASCWDEPSVDFIDHFDPPCYKIASASINDLQLLKKTRATGKPIILSTGMSTMHEIDLAISALVRDNLLIAHATSTYPCPLNELNLRMITTLRDRYPDCPIGYSGHEVGLAPTTAAVVLGASFVERHITADRALWGSDQAASVEIGGFHKLVANIRDIEQALGDGIKQVYDSELIQKKRLRKHTTLLGTMVPTSTNGSYAAHS
jgi:N-acetylneuraminate synthase